MPKEKCSCQLSQHERAVLCLIAEGYKDKEIANELRIRENTVRETCTHLMKKLSVRSLSSGVRSAMEKGVITLYEVLESRFSKRNSEVRCGRPQGRPQGRV
jgi:DNA-binding NarL/FixJ family response regulator